MATLDPLDKELHRKIKFSIRTTSRPFYSPHGIQINLIDLKPFVPKLRDCVEKRVISQIIRNVYAPTNIDPQAVSALADYVEARAKSLLSGKSL